MGDERWIGLQSRELTFHLTIRQGKENAPISELDHPFHHIKHTGIGGDCGQWLESRIEMQAYKSSPTGIAHLMDQPMIHRLNLTRLVITLAIKFKLGSIQPKQRMRCRSKRLDYPPVGRSMIMNRTKISRDPAHNHELNKIRFPDQSPPVTIFNRVAEICPWQEILLNKSSISDRTLETGKARGGLLTN